VSDNTKPLTEADLDQIALCAAEDRTTAGYATPRPWKWWTANSMRSLRSEAGRSSEVVAYGKQHPHDGVIDIAIDEADMALIEHAVNTFERRCDTVVRLVDEVRRLRDRIAELRYPEGER
jgi:acyl-CoA reductase-like NAD-dependent aldehyde dehydrogenase